MEKYQVLIDYLNNCNPFALARFNDGEAMAMFDPNALVARGDQRSSLLLQKKLFEALQGKEENYFVGLPCSLCYPHLAQPLGQAVQTDDEFKTHAVVFTNRNWKRAVKDITEAVQGRPVYWMSGDDQDPKKIPGIKEVLVDHFKVPTQDAFASYQNVKDWHEKFPAGSVVFLSCGPLARVLAKEWFEARPEVTFIDIGSTFDPFTRGVEHNCHKGWDETGFNLVKRCEECN